MLRRISFHTKLICVPTAAAQNLIFNTSQGKALHSDGLKQMKHLYRELDPALQTHIQETTLKKMMAQVHKIEREGHAVNRLEDAEKAAPSASIKKAILDADKQEIGQLYKLDTEEKSVQHGDKDDEKFVSGMLKELTAVKGLDEEELNLE